MSRTSFKRLAFVMFVIFMANFGISAVQSNWVNHEIEHALHQVPMSVMDASFNNADHTNLHDNDSDTDSDSDSVSVIGHQLLHAVDHLQLFPSAALNFRIPKTSGMVLHHFTPVKLPVTAFEAPFRPPRHTTLAI